MSCAPDGDYALSRFVSSDAFFTWSYARITFRLASILLFGSFEPGINALYFASISLHWIPRGPEARGASTVLVKR